MHYLNIHASEEQNELALDVIDEVLGEIVHHICKLLIKYGPLQLKDIVNYAKSNTGVILHTPLAESQIKSALAVAMRHHIIIVKMSSQKRTMAPRAVYHLSPRRAIMLSRGPKMYQMIGRRFSILHQFVFSELFLEGSDSCIHVAKNVCARCFWCFKSSSEEANRYIHDIREHLNQHEFLKNKPNWYQGGEYYDNCSGEELWKLDEGRALIDLAQRAFEDLALAGVVVPCEKIGVHTETADLHEAELDDSPSLSPISNNGKSQKLPIAAAASPHHPIKPKTTDTNKNNALANKLKRKGVKRKALDVEQVEEEAKSRDHHFDTEETKAPYTNGKSSNAVRAATNGTDIRNGSLWYRCSWNYFLQSYRAELVADYWGSLLDGNRDSRWIIDAICKHSIIPNYHKIAKREMLLDSCRVQREDDPEFALPSNLSETCSVADILRYNNGSVRAHLQETFDGAPEVVVREVLELLHETHAGFMFDKMNSRITFHWRQVLDLIQCETAYDYIGKRHGSDALKILRLLDAKGALEDPQVSDIGIMSQRSARGKLMELFRYGYLVQEEASKRLDLPAANTSYLYRNDQVQLLRSVTLFVYKTLLNLRIRLHATKNKNQILYKSGAQHEDEGTKLSNVHGMSHYLQLKRVLDKLEQSIEKVDSMCILMADLKIPPPPPSSISEDD